MRMALCAAMILLVIAGCGRSPDRLPGPARFSADQSGLLMLVTFNIRYGTAQDGLHSWEHRREIVFDLLAGYQADVIGLQEALDFQMDQIHQALPGYEVIAAGRDDGLRAGEACPILYRSDRFTLINSGTFWFSDTPGAAGSKHWGNDLPRICTWVYLRDRFSGENFYVYNLHLDHQSQASRVKSTEMLADRIDRQSATNPYVVMGDFNIDMSNPAMRCLQEDGYERSSVRLVDSWRVYHRDRQPVGTWHGFRGHSDTAKIDHILVPEQTEILEAGIDQRSFDGRYPADHFPVFTKINLFAY